MLLFFLKGIQTTEYDRQYESYSKIGMAEITNEELKKKQRLNIIQMTQCMQYQNVASLIRKSNLYSVLGSNFLNKQIEMQMLLIWKEYN